MSRPDRRPHAGFAAPLAVIILMAVALLGVLMVEGSLGELRMGVAVVAESRVAAGAESALVEALAQRFDTAALSHPAGSLLVARHTVTRDSVILRIQSLGPGVGRIIVKVVSRRPLFRVSAGRMALVALTPDSLQPGQLRIRPLGPHWWVAAP